MTAANGSAPVRKLVALAPDLLAEVRDFRHANQIDTETEAIRRLIRAGLDHYQTGKTQIRAQQAQARAMTAHKAAGTER